MGLDVSIVLADGGLCLSAFWHHDGMRWWGKQRSVAAGRDIGVAVTGDNNQVLLASPVRSAYWEQVRRIAPPELMGRDAELRELADFCTAHGGPAYAWWRAPAWAGKTALMSTFALRPPAGVRIVPFFVTARLGAQNDVTAYVDVVMEQLAELVGEDLPVHLTEATREAHLLHLYGVAARACADQGQRLVLLLDGLDEDRGVTTDTEAHSIAGLLPALLDGGMRVLVAGRLNPPLPGDVPEGHPLRDLAIVRTLSLSPHAQVVRTEAERELKRLAEAGGLEYDLLALVTAASGGLTAEDLATLTGAVPYRVRDVLRTRAGRTFGLRVNVYLLGHEELQSQAEEMLGAAELDRYRRRLHDWAEDWRARNWPEETPAYLLRGYFRVLRASHDVQRLFVLALDEARHDRLLAATGSDAAALSEIRDTKELLAAAAPADLLMLLQLAVQRARLSERNQGVSVTLCRAWAELGETEKALALARTVPASHLRVEALVAVAGVLRAGGRHRKVREVLTDAENELDRTGRVHTPYDVAAMVAVLKGLAESGLDDRGRADRLAERIGRVVSLDAKELVDVVAYWESTGRPEQAERLAREAGPATRCAALTRLAVIRTESGELSSAEALHEEVHRSSVGDRTTSAAVREMVRAGEFARAEVLIEAAIGERPEDPDLRELMVTVLVRAGDLERAEEWAESIDDRLVRCFAEATLACALARSGRVAEARTRAAAIPEEYARAEVTTAVIEALAAAGRFEEAQIAAGRAGRSRTHDDALVRGALAQARSGNSRAARVFVAGIEAAARDRIPPSRRAWELAEAAEELRAAGWSSAARKILEDVEKFLPPRPEASDSGQEEYAYDSLIAWIAERIAGLEELDRAEALLYTAFEPYHCSGAWSVVLRARVLAAEYERVDALISELGDDEELGDVLRAEAALQLAEIGQIARASKFAEAVRGPWRRAAALAAIAEGMAVAGEGAAARRLLDGLRDAATHDESSHSHWEEVLAITHRYRAWRALGDDFSALEAIETARSTLMGTFGLAGQLVQALVETGWSDFAENLVDELAGRGTDTLVEALVAAGDYDRAAKRAGLGAGSGRVNPSAATTLVPVVDPALGRELAVQLLLGEGSWLGALSAVAHLEPRVVPWIVETLRPSTAARTSAQSEN